MANNFNRLILKLNELDARPINDAVDEFDPRGAYKKTIEISKDLKVHVVVEIIDNAWYFSIHLASGTVLDYNITGTLEQVKSGLSQFAIQLSQLGTALSAALN